MNTARLLKEISEAHITPKIEKSYFELTSVFPLCAIQNEKHHKNALFVVEKLIDHAGSENVSDKGVLNYLAELTDHIEAYETEQLKKVKTSPKEILKYLMELKGLTQIDLRNELGGQSVVSKVLSGERELNIRQILALSKKFGVTPATFLPD